MFSIEYAKALQADRLREATERRRALAIRARRPRPVQQPRWWSPLRPARRLRYHRAGSGQPCATC